MKNSFGYLLFLSPLLLPINEGTYPAFPAPPLPLSSLCAAPAPPPIPAPPTVIFIGD